MRTNKNTDKNCQARTIMKNLFKTMCVLGITLIASSLYQVVHAQTAFDKGIQSPTAASLGEYGNEQISLYTGKASKSIPLGTLNAGNYALNIGLSYNYNGFKPEIIPGSTGMGWALNAGGVITRTVQSIRDEDDNGYSKNSVYTAYQNPVNSNLLYEVITGGKDAKPDMFYFNVNGLSGRFFYDKYGNFQVDSYRNLDIVWSNPQDTTSTFTIIDIDGTKYTFGGSGFNEITQSKTEVLGDNPTVPEPTDPYVSAWYLKEIETVNGESITFQYEKLIVNISYPYLNNANYRERKIFSEEVKSLTGPNTYSQAKTWDLRPTSLWVSQISNDSQTITINYSGRTDFTDQKKVDNIIFSTNNSGTTYDFTYDELGTTGVNSRLILKGIDISASSSQIPGWEFDYYGEELTGSLPDITTVQVDFWGYYNAESGNTNISYKGLPEHFYYDKESASTTFQEVLHIPGMVLDPDHTKSSIGLIKTITYPTGGKADYTYEPNSYSYISDITDTLYEFVQEPTFTDSITFKHTGGGTYSPSAPYYNTSHTIEITGDEPLELRTATSFAIDSSGFVPAVCPVSTYPQVFGETPGPDCYGFIYMKEHSGGLGSRVGVPFEEDGFVVLDPGTYSVEFELNEDAIDDLESGLLDKVFYRLDITPFLKPVEVDELPGPGHRVKEIKIFDGIDSTKNQVRKFEYIDTSNPVNSSGVLVSEIVTQFYFESEYEKCTGNFPLTWSCNTVVDKLVRYRNSGSVMPLGSTQGSPLGYAHVQEKIISTDGTLTKHYRYSSPLEFPDSGLNFPLFNGTSHDYGRGSLTSEKTYNSSSQLIREKIHSYTHTTNNSDTVGHGQLSPRWEVRRLGYIDEFSFVPGDLVYNLPVWSRLSSVTEKVFEGGVPSVEKTTTTSYNSENHQPSIITETVPGETKRTVYEYAYEITDDGAGNSYAGMATKNMLVQPFSVVVEDSAGVTSWETLNKSWTRWDTPISGASDIWLADEQWLWDGLGSAPAKPTTSDVFKAAEVLSYDSHGNAIEIEDASGAVTHFYYGTTASPLSQSGSGVHITGIQRVIGTADAIPGGGTRPTSGDDLFIEAQYNSLGKPTKIIGENGQETTFSYDNFGRLSSSNNDAGDQVSSYVYTLTGSSFSSINPNWIQTTMNTGSGTRVSRQYMDGLGRFIQSVAKSTSEVILTQQDYNNRGLPWRSWKPINRAGTGLGYHSTYATVADNKYGSGSKPYTEVKYESNSLGRAIKTIPMGGEATYGAVSTSYSVENIDGGSEYYSVTTTTDQEGNVTKTYTDGWGRTIRTVSDPTGINAITEFTYNLINQLTEVRPPNYFNPPSGSVANDWVINYTYDALGNMTSKTSNDFGTVNYAYDEASRLRFSQDANQLLVDQVAYITYDELGRMIKTGIADYSGSVTALDPDTEQSFENFGDYQKGAYAYDAKPSTSSHPWSEFATEISNFSMNTDRAKGQLVADMYRFMPEPLEANVDTSGLGISGAETYRAIDTLSIGMSDALSGSNVLFEAGRGVVWKDGFTAFSGSDVTARIDVDLAGTDSVGINSQTGVSPWQLQLYSYDSEGRVAEKHIYTGDRRDWDVKINYVYNRLGEITRRKVEIGEDALYHHYAYDDLGRITSVTLTADGVVDTESAEITYSYETDGQLEQKQYKGGTTFDYEYDIQSRLTKINDPAVSSHVFSAAYTYFKNGNIKEAQFYNPLTSLGSGHYRFRYLHTYDKLNRLTSALYNNYSGGWAFTEAFWVNGLTYDANGNITSLRRKDEAGSLIDNLSYQYGSSNRLNGVTDIISTTTEAWDAEDATYGYDANGNMTSQTGKFSNLVYNEFNLPIQIETTAGHTLKASYNGAGERILKEFSEGTWTYYIRDGGTTLATVDYGGDLNFNLIGMGTEGQLLGGVTDPVIDLSSTISSESESNDNQGAADGPVGLTTSGSITGSDDDWYYFEVLRSGTVTITEAKTTGEYETGQYDMNWEVFKSGSVATGTGSGSFSVTPGTYYIRLEALQGISDYYYLKLSAQSSSEYATRYFLKDHLGSTRAIVDEVGTHLDSYDYYPFGLEMPGRVSTSGTQIDPYKYTGHERDEETGINLDYMLARGYDPAIGRFLQVDPLAHIYQNYTPYHYVLNNPITNIDPTGKYVVKGTTVSRISVSRAVSATLVSFTGIGGPMVLGLKAFSGDPSFSNSGFDYATLGAGKSLRYGKRALARFSGVSDEWARAITRSGEISDNIISGSGALLSAAVDLLGQDTFNSLKKDEIIFGVAKDHLKDENGKYGYLDSGGPGGDFTNRYRLKASTIENVFGGDEDRASAFLSEQFGNFNEDANRFITENGLDLSTFHDRYRLRKELIRKKKERDSLYEQ